MVDQMRFQNQDLVLRVSNTAKTSVFDINDYEPFIEALCGNRHYQKDAIRAVLRYFLGGRYSNLRELAEENYRSNHALAERFGAFQEMERHLQLPDQLSCSVDLATSTGKSFVMYAIARIMLACGAVDRVLILCPSVAIEKGLTDKFRYLSSDPEFAAFKELLPSDSVVRNPQIINGTESIINGSICIENYHATLDNAQSSIRDSLGGKGARTLVLNDEVHHVYNSSGNNQKRWKEFLVDPAFGFHYMAGFSGTCYIGNEYFSDVITRYSLRESIEQGFSKAIEYVAEDISASHEEKLQKIYGNHKRNKVLYRKVKPLTIMVTRDISMCKRLTAEVIEFLAWIEGVSIEDASKKVLIVTSAPEHQANVAKLDAVDQPNNPVEWITSVSMLTEGWDVQNVFQIVPHEERAFNSKLLISQVLGRGLRVPAPYRGERPIVTVFNHDNWSSKIKGLVDEVLEIERRIYSYPVAKVEDYNFVLHHIDYSKEPETEVFQHVGGYDFNKGYISLASQSSDLPRETTYIDAATGKTDTRKLVVSFKMFTVDEVAEHVYNHYSAIDLEEGEDSNFAELYPLDRLRETIRNSLRRVGETKDIVSAGNRQRILASFGTMQRGSAKRVRYRMIPDALVRINTAERPRDSVGIGALRRGEETIFLDEFSSSLSDEETRYNLQAVMDDELLPRSAWEEVPNAFDFKTPQNVVIANHTPERQFIRHLVKSHNVKAIDAWVKSTDRDFYTIEYAWRKGEHTKHGFFNPDFFIKKGDHVFVIEIKGEEEVFDPSEENKAKYKAARQHFTTLNNQQDECEYHFHFLTPQSSYDTFFQFVRDGNYDFVSEIDAILEGNGN